MKPRRFESDTMVSRSRTDAATSSVSTGMLVTKGSPLIRDRGMAARDDWSPDRSRCLDPGDRDRARAGPSALAQAQDRDVAIGLRSISGVLRRVRRDPGPSGLEVLAFERLGSHGDAPPVVEFDRRIGLL